MAFFVHDADLAMLAMATTVHLGMCEEPRIGSNCVGLAHPLSLSSAAGTA